MTPVSLPAALQSLDACARKLDTPCGAGAMRWRIWGTGPPLVLLHGGSGSWMHWAHNIEVFAKARTVVVPDLPGLGQSARPVEPDRLGSYAESIAVGLEAVLGPRPTFDLVAFSFGSIITGALLGVPELHIDRLVLVGPAALGVSKLNRALVPVRALHGEARRAANAENLGILMFADPARIDATAIDIQDWNTRHTRTNSPRFARTTSLRDALAAWGRPFAAISGEKDATSQPPLVGPVLRAVYRPVDYRILPGIGHWCMYEGAVAFNALISEMLSNT